MTGPEDFEVRLGNLVTRDEAIGAEWFALARELQNFAERRQAVRLHFRREAEEAEAEQSDDGKPIPEGVKQLRGRGAKAPAVDALEGEAGERFDKAIAAALDDDVNVKRSEAA